MLLLRLEEEVEGRRRVHRQPNSYLVRVSIRKVVLYVLSSYLLPAGVAPNRTMTSLRIGGAARCLVG